MRWAFHYHESMNTPLLTAMRPRPHTLLRWLGTACLTMHMAHVPAMAQTSPQTGAPAQQTTSALDARLFYQLLLSELSLQQGDPGAAYSLVLDAARRTRDGQLFQRAIQMSLQARAGDSALAAAKAWVDSDASSVDARRFELQILLATSKVADTPPVLEALLNLLPLKARTEALHAVAQTYARVPDKAQTLRLLQPLLDKLALNTDLRSAAMTALARLQWAADAKSAALNNSEQAIAADPSDTQAALFALELMENGERSAEPWLLRHLNTEAGRANAGLRVAYARVLLDQQRMGDARRQLQDLTRSRPKAAEAWLLQAGLELQEKKPDDAQRSAERFLALARDSGNERLLRAMNQAYLILAQAAEQQQDYASANAWLDRVENQDEVLAAQVRRASLLARQNRMADARALLRKWPERRPEDVRVKFVAEAQLLREFKQFDAAYAVYQEAMQRLPEDSDLMYEAAMAAERAQRLDEMERLLRRVIALNPEQAHAYNALGYSLADRNLRLPEARQLIEKAVTLAPNDAYIRDSLAWVAFREGNLPKARELLESAYRQQPDAEIAAHLGEVLWAMGQQTEARRIWREGLLLSSDNETLLGTLKRLNVQP